MSHRELDLDRGPDCLLVKIRGHVQEEIDAAPLVDELWHLLNQHLTFRLVVELDEIDIVNSYLIGQLISLARRIWDRGGMIRLCGLSPESRKMLRQYGLTDVLPTYCTRDEAIFGTDRR